MFFFFAYDGYRDRRQTPSTLTSIPTLAQRNGDFRALPVTIYDPRTTRPNPNGTGFVRDPFPGQHHSRRIASRRSRRSFQSFLPEPTSSSLQNNYLGGSLPIGFNNVSVTAKIDLKLNERQQGSVLFSHGKRSQATAVSAAAPMRRRHCRCRTRRRVWVEEIPTSAQVKHTYVLGLAVGQSGRLRVLAPGGADLQRDHRRSISDQGRSARIAGRGGGFIVPRDVVRRPERADADGAAQMRGRSRSI